MYWQVVDNTNFDVKSISFCVTNQNKSPFCFLDKHGAVTKLPKMFEEIVLKSMPLIKEAFLPNYREDDLLSFQRANKDLEGKYVLIYLYRVSQGKMC